MKSLNKLKKEFLKIQQNNDARRIVYPVALRLKVMKALESGFVLLQMLMAMFIVLDIQMEAWES
jgi:hypothetical protein